MEILSFPTASFFSLLLTIMRISMVVFMLPFFGAGSIPSPVKGALCIVMSLAVWPKLQFPGSMLPQDTLGLVLMFAGELVLGLVLDIIIRFLFAAVMIGGHFIGFAMGFSMMNVLDPTTGTSESVTSLVLYQSTVLIFLTMNGHLLLLQGLAESFTLVPPGGLFITPQLGESILRFSAQMFALGARISAPILASLFLVDLALALISRAAPQMNVLMLGFPIKITVGFLFMTLVLTALSHFVGDYLIDLGPMFTAAMTAGPK